MHAHKKESFCMEDYYTLWLTSPFWHSPIKKHPQLTSFLFYYFLLPCVMYPHDNFLKTNSIDKEKSEVLFLFVHMGDVEAWKVFTEAERKLLRKHQINSQQSKGREWGWGHTYTQPGGKCLWKRSIWTISD